MRQEENKALLEFLNNGSTEADQAEAGNRLGEKKCLDKENPTISSAVKKRGRKRKPLKEIQVRLSKRCGVYCYNIVPILTTR